MSEEVSFSLFYKLLHVATFFLLNVYFLTNCLTNLSQSSSILNVGIFLIADCIFDINK